MAQLDDLNTAVSNLQTQANTNASDITAALTKLSAAAPQNLQPAIDAIKAAVSGLATSDAALGNAVNPNPPGIPVSGTPAPGTGSTPSTGTVSPGPTLGSPENPNPNVAPKP